MTVIDDNLEIEHENPEIENDNPEIENDNPEIENDNNGNKRYYATKQNDKRRYRTLMER